MVKNLALLLLFVFSFSACNMLEKKDTSTGIKKKKKLAEDDGDGEAIQTKSAIIDYDTKTNSDAKILNNIIVHESGGLKVARAFLSFEDGSLVPKTNRTELGKPVYLNLLVKSGWKVDNGMVSIDASEKIVSDAGELVLDATNLFKASRAIQEKNSGNIYLKAVITKTRTEINYFIINYLVWDKLGHGEIKDSYRLFVDEAAE